MATAYDPRLVVDADSVAMLGGVLADGIDTNRRGSQGFAALHNAMDFLPHDHSQDQLGAIKHLMESGSA